MTAAQIYADPELAVYASGMDIVLDRWIRERDGSQPRPEIHVLWLQGELSSLSLMSAVRAELSKRFGAAWGEWTLGDVAQPQLSGNTRAVMVSLPSKVERSEVDSDLSKLCDQSPLQVRRTYQQTFWARWEFAVIVNEVSHPFESVLRELLSAYRLTVMRISDASGESVRQQVGEGFDLCMSDGLPELSDGDVVESPFAELESGEAVLQCEKDGNLPSVELSPEELAGLARILLQLLQLPLSERFGSSLLFERKRFDDLTKKCLVALTMRSCRIDGTSVEPLLEDFSDLSQISEELPWLLSSGRSQKLTPDWMAFLADLNEACMTARRVLN